MFFKLGAARGNYLAMGQPDLSFPAGALSVHVQTKEEGPGTVAEGGSVPCWRAHVILPFTLARFGTPFRVCVDTGFVGCHATRRSASGGCALFGKTFCNTHTHGTTRARDQRHLTFQSHNDLPHLVNY